MAGQPKVYIETTIVSYLTCWPSRDVVRLSHEVLTRTWWDRVRPRLDPYTSELVRREASAGDPAAAEARLNALAGIALLAPTPAVEALAVTLAHRLALPPKALLDAAHLATAAVHGIDFLLTWNCRHLANAMLAGRIDAACHEHGFAPPRVVTPEQLMMEDDDHDG